MPGNRPKIVLFHAPAVDPESRLEVLQASDYSVLGAIPGPAALRKVRESPPDAVVIDLSRTPSTGRDVAVWLRTTKATRQIPIVFAGGEPEKLEPIRKLLPDATYASWVRISRSLQLALKNRPTDPVVPASRLAGYSGTPLPKKLGIKPHSVVALAGAPPDFEETLGPLPEGVTLRRNLRGTFHLLLWFPKSTADLQRRVARIRDSLGPGGVWIVWPKQASGVATDLTQTVVREAGLANGLVDYKVAALAATFTGLKFAHRKGA